MKLIPLTRGFVATVDDECFEKVMAFGKWVTCFSRCETYPMAVCYTGQRKSITLHRFLLNITDPSIFIDHINHDTLDCQLHNIRVATPSQNMGNRRMNKNNKSGFKGVSWHSQKGKWYASLSHKRKKILSKCFDDPLEAAHAYDRAAILLFGDFALTNRDLGLIQ